MTMKTWNLMNGPIRTTSAMIETHDFFVLKALGPVRWSFVSHQFS